jgi:hypothetical protein
VVDHLVEAANDKDMLGHLKMSSALMVAQRMEIWIVERLLKVVGERNQIMYAL